MAAYSVEFHTVIVTVLLTTDTTTNFKLTTFGMVASATNRLTTIMTTRHSFGIYF